MAEPVGRVAAWATSRLELPRLVTTPGELRRLTLDQTAAGQTVGLVPTMGSLHQGHMSLVAAAQRECDFVVVSIFVNPLQFGVDEDFLTYPRQLDADLRLLAERKVDASYCPAVATVYPPDFATKVLVDAGGELWEAASRPGHFTGVATVVAKLLAATGPCRAYFGEKDAQQVAVVARLAADLDLGAEVRICPTVRDHDGVALSSRNQLLSKAGREAARCLSLGLTAAARQFGAGNRSGAELGRAIAAAVAAEPNARLDYAGVVNAEDFQPVPLAESGSRALVAAEIEGIHLIDTALLDSPPSLGG